MTRPLLPFQEIAVQKIVNFLMSGTQGCYNASEQGLGKGLETIEACDRVGIKAPLVICPKSVKLVWRKEVEKWKAKGEWTIASYDDTRLKKVSPEFFDALIIDEAHYLKNHLAQRTKAVLNYYWPLVPFRMALSGTPFTNCVLDCWTLFSRFAPEHFDDYYSFANRYCYRNETPWGTKFEGLKNAEELKKIIKAKFFFRDLKSEVIKDLPDKIFQDVPLPHSLAVKLTKDEEEAYEKYIEILRGNIAKGLTCPPPPISVATKVKEQGLKKVSAIVDFSKDLLDQDIPIVIFAWHREVIKELVEGLKAYKPVSISGDTSDRARAAAVNNFQDGITNCFVGQYAAAGTGVTLTRGWVFIAAELCWSYAMMAQAFDRLHRIGQKNSVNIYIPIVQKSWDERQFEVLVDKNRMAKEILG